MDSLMEIMVPVPYCGWRIRIPTEKSEALFFFLTAGFVDAEDEENIPPSELNPDPPPPKMLFGSDFGVGASRNSSGISLRNRDFGLAEYEPKLYRSNAREI